MLEISTITVLIILALVTVSRGFDQIKVSPLVVEEQLLWIAGQDNVGGYRIPLLTYTPNGNLLAFCEARKNSGADSGPKFLAMRRSVDRGQTWKTQEFVYSDGDVQDGLNLGVVVVDDIKKTIFVFFTTCAHYIGCDTSSQFFIKSTNDGVTWSLPYNVSEQIGTKMFAGGPGYGIQKQYAPHKGRLIVCGHSTLPGDGLFCLLSDDHGDTWRRGGTVKSIPYNKEKITGDFVPDECQPAELPDGSIMVNVRNQYQFHCHCRIIVTSYDGAETFNVDDLYFDTTLVDPTVAASILYHRGVLFFTNPENDTHRENMTLRWSYDNGTSWDGTLNIYPKKSGYSTMTAIKNDTYGSKFIYILYEKGVSSTYQYLSFAKVSLTGEL